MEKRKVSVCVCVCVCVCMCESNGVKVADLLTHEEKKKGNDEVHALAVSDLP